MEDYSFPLSGRNAFDYSLKFLSVDNSAEWVAAFWLKLGSKDAAPAYQFMLFDDINNQRIAPEVRIHNLGKQGEITSQLPHIAYPLDAELKISLTVEGRRVKVSVNGSVVDARELGFALDQLKLGFSSGTFLITGNSRSMPAERPQPEPKTPAGLVQERLIEVPLRGPILMSAGPPLAQFVPAIDATEEGGECVTLNLESGDSIVQLAFPQRKLAKRFVGIKYDSSGQRRTYSDTRNETVMISPTEPSTAVMLEFQRGSAWAMNHWPDHPPELSVGDIEAALDEANLGSPRRMMDLLHTRCGAP